ncbi:MAG: RluA family pseudouridine synthase [Deltaproteobacteria bacterium]|nr:RluA family pseudouridine synthase [Deltaproteobacteria bacterium]
MWRWFVEKEDEGNRLDHFLRDQDPGLTRSQIKKLIDAGYAAVDGSVARPAHKMRAGQETILRIPPPEPLSASPEDIPLDVRFEDDWVVVVNKQQGLVVHPAPGHPGGTLVNAILFGRTARGGDPLRPGIVHRLDKDTSGLMVVAKREDAHASLAHQFHEHSVERRYKVLVAGNPPDRGEWSTLHGRKPRDRRLFSSKVTRGKQAVSRYVTRERFPGAAFIEVVLLTGRTHQVRVHCNDHGHSVLGDPWYGPNRLSPSLQKIHKELPGQALHAGILGFEHPGTGEHLLFESEPPKPFLDALSMLRDMC